MADIDVIKQYLVRLGFSTDAPALEKFDHALRKAGQAVERVTSGMAKQAAVAGTEVIASLTGIAGAALGLMTNVADADLSFQMFARRMFINTDAARHMKIALDALGVSAEDVIWGPPELAQRYRALEQLQIRIEKEFGGTAEMEKRLRQFRDVEFKFTEFKVTLGQLARGATMTLVDRLFGDGKVQAKLEEWLNWLIINVPRLSTELADALTPTLKDMYRIWEDLVAIGRDATSMFLEFVGAVYGDQQLSKGEVTIKNIGLALTHIADTVRMITDDVRWLIDQISKHPIVAKTLGGALAGGAAASVIPGVGTGVGALVGGAIGFTAGAGQAMGAFDERTTPRLDIAGQAQAAADYISRITGVPARWLYGQFVHETGGFTNRGATQLHNLAGIKAPGGADYRDFGDFQSFADYYARLIMSPRYRSALQAKTDAEYFQALKAGGYYEDSYGNYLSGARRGENLYHPQSYTPGHTNVDVGGVTVHVTQPNASAQEIADLTAQKVADQTARRVQANLLQMSGAYA